MGQDGNERELFRLYVGGNEDAFRQFYAQVSPKVWSFVKKRIADAALAEEVFQEAWLKIHRSRDRYDPKFNPMAWVYTLTRSVLIDRMRALGSRPEVLLPPEDLERQESASRFVGVESPMGQMAGLDSALAALPPDQRELLRQRYEKEWSFEEIARVAGVRQETIRKRLSRLLQNLRRRV